MPSDRAAIAEILRTSRRIAVVGLSPKPERPSHGVAAYLQRAGYTIIPVRPTGATILGEPVHSNLRAAAAAGPIDIVDVFRRSEFVPALLDDLLAIRPRLVWLQVGIRDDADGAAARGRRNPGRDGPLPGGGPPIPGGADADERGCRRRPHRRLRDDPRHAPGGAAHRATGRPSSSRLGSLSRRRRRCGRCPTSRCPIPPRGARIISPQPEREAHDRRGLRGHVLPRAATSGSPPRRSCSAWDTTTPAGSSLPPRPRLNVERCNSIDEQRALGRGRDAVDRRHLPGREPTSSSRRSLGSSAGLLVNNQSPLPAVRRARQQRRRAAHLRRQQHGHPAPARLRRSASGPRSPRARATRSAGRSATTSSASRGSPAPPSRGQLPPHETAYKHIFSINVGLDVILERRRGRRY